MLSQISNLRGGKFGVENAISNLEFGGWQIWGGKCYLKSRIWGVENLGRKIFHPPNSRFEIAYSTPNFTPPQIRNFEIAFSTPNFTPPQIRDSRQHFPPQIFHPPNSRFEIAFSTPNFPPPQIRNFEIAFSTPNFPPPPQIRDSRQHFPPQIFHPPQIRDSR